jgi:hypothetical protein
VAKLKITGVAGLEGEFAFDPVYSHRDFRTIKRLSGVRAAEVMDALNAGDLEVVVAMAVITLERAGVPFTEDQIWDSDAGSITIVADEEEEASPPVQELSPSNEDESESSGNATNGALTDSPETVTLPGAGIRDWATGAESDPVTSQT